MPPRPTLFAALVIALGGCTATASVQPAPVASVAITQPAASAAPTAKPSLTPTPAASPSADVKPTGGTPIKPDCTRDFAEFDLDKDGFLSYDEYTNGKYGRIRYIRAPSAEEEANFKANIRKEAVAADVNKDNKLSREEFDTTGCGV